MIWIIVLVILAAIVFFFLRDRHKMIKRQVGVHGGMKKKYATLIDWLTNEPSAKVVKVTSDYVQINCIMKTTATYFFITETFGGVEIEWVARLGIMGNHKLKWYFSSNTTEIEIIQKLSDDLEELNKKLF